jgi:hypothetical protein
VAKVLVVAGWVVEAEGATVRETAVATKVAVTDQELVAVATAVAMAVVLVAAMGTATEVEGGTACREVARRRAVSRLQRGGSYPCMLESNPRQRI